MTPEERKVYMREWHIKNKERRNKTARQNYIENRESVLERTSRNAKANPERTKKYSQKHYDKIKGTEEFKVRSAAQSAKRRASKKNATPEWADLDKIKLVYKKAKELEKITGLKYHVDHVIPLHNDNVCGLHCWANLQILEAGLNISKGNRV